MVRGDVKAWLQASGWKYVSGKKHWVKGGFVLWVESSMLVPDRLTWLLTDKKSKLASGSSVTETLYETLNKFD